MFGSSRFAACFSVAGPNATVLAVVNLSDIKAWAELLLIVLSILYTIWRWRRDSYVICAACRNGVPPPTCPLPLRKRPSWCPHVDVRVLLQSDQI